MAGLVWRPVTRADLAALVELAAECHQTDGGFALMIEPGNLRDRCFPDTPGTGLGAFASDGRLAACSTVHLSHQAEHETAVMVGQVRPEFRRRGIGTHLLRWSQTQAQALFGTTTHWRLLRIATESLTESADRLYRAHGFEPVFEALVMQYDLRQPLPDRPMPPDVSFATWQPALAEQFFQAYAAAFRERPGFPGYTAAEWISDINDNENFNPEWSLLARVGNRPAGFVNASAERPGGYVVQVGVIPDQRRRGLASALIVESMRRMRGAGVNAVQLEVNVNNPGAIQTYATLGFVTVGRRARYEQTAESNVA